ncbi:MAG: ABC transporter permease [Anaerolineales bacterium]
MLIARLDPQLIRIIGLTLQVSGSALLLACLFGIPAGVLLGLVEFRGRKLLQLLVSTGMGLPPVVVGLVVYLLLSRQGPLGGLDWLFTPQAMILAQSILAFPLAAGLTSAAVREVPANLVLQIRSLGATHWQERWVVLRQARRGVLAAVVAAFGRIIAEVGAVILAGGNIAGKTRVLSTAIVLETRQGNFDLALALGLILLGLALLGNTLFLRLETAKTR